MGLTSHKVLALSALVSVLMVAATVWLWPRLAKRSWATVFGRLGTILATQLAVMCTVGLVANNYFAFYSSWADLIGSNQDGPVVIQSQLADGRKGAVVQTISNENVRGANTVGREPAVVGKLEKIRIPGAATGLTTEGYVYLPPQYFQPEFKDRKFPAAIAITGFPGDAKNLITKLNYPSTELSLINEGKTKPYVLVLMRPSPAMPRDTECEDIPGGPQSETYFAQDVPQTVRDSYRVASGPGSWGVIGNSTGGYCALKLAMKHPDVFAAGVSLSGYYKAAEDPTTGDLFGGSQDRRNQADLDWRLANLPKPEVSLLVGGSKEGDGDYYPSTKAFAEAAKGSATKVSSITLDTGGHNFNTWSRMLPASLGWLGDKLNAPA
ncbi:enterochelin esterase-like enzyme [Kitasatospora gansuensis]|uniref:Enterochelin esterase-like enzyme n=1 Tax=Kitasatospora gansuensis TaxID=258050 RepID=A0A7W7SBJ8_9ACTN|nr:alpha/beta hydrolase-fold protein [Kitasatospora gansuensis]MBB4947470.1 enterochelin esterase-like enzyme [Kitasatospora gansuensis]